MKLGISLLNVLALITIGGCASNHHLVFFTNTTLGVEMSSEYFPNEQTDTHLENRKKHNRLGNIMTTISSAEAVIKAERVDTEDNALAPNERHGWEIYYA